MFAWRTALRFSILAFLARKVFLTVTNPLTISSVLFKKTKVNEDATVVWDEEPYSAGTKAECAAFANIKSYNAFKVDLEGKSCRIGTYNGQFDFPVDQRDVEIYVDANDEPVTSTVVTRTSTTVTSTTTTVTTTVTTTTLTITEVTTTTTEEPDFERMLVVGRGTLPDTNQMQLNAMLIRKDGTICRTEYMTDFRTGYFSGNLQEIDGTFYVLGGIRDATNYPKTGHVFKFNKASDNDWVQTASMPKAKTGFGSASSGKYIYVFGGTGTHGSELASIEVYDTEEDTWKTLGTNLESPAKTAVARVEDDIAVVCDKTAKSFQIFNLLPSGDVQLHPDSSRMTKVQSCRRMAYIGDEIWAYDKAHISAMNMEDIDQGWRIVTTNFGGGKLDVLAQLSRDTVLLLHESVADDGDLKYQEFDLTTRSVVGGTKTIAGTTPRMKYIFTTADIDISCPGNSG